MNNEEMNSAMENEAVEENNSPEKKEEAKKPLPKSVIGMIIGGFVMLILAIVLLVTFFPANDNQGGGEGDQGNTDTKINYTVTVVDGDGNPIKGAKVTFTPKGATEIPDIKTDAEGKASFKTDKELTVKITYIPMGYEYDKLNQAQGFDNDGKLTVTVNKLSPFVIKVVDQDGNPVAGVKVQMCDISGSCRMPVTTNANGEGTYAYEDGEFKAQLTNGLAALPDGYTCDNPEEYHYFENGVVTIIVTKTAD